MGEAVGHSADFLQTESVVHQHLRVIFSGFKCKLVVFSGRLVFLHLFVYFCPVEVQIDVIRVFINAEGNDGHGAIDFINIFGSNGSKNKNGFFAVFYLEEVVEVDVGAVVVVFGEVAEGEVVLGLEEIGVFLDGEFK